MNTIGFLVIDSHTTAMIRAACKQQSVQIDIWVTLALRAAAAEVIQMPKRSKKPNNRKRTSAKVTGIPLDENPC